MSELYLAKSFYQQNAVLGDFTIKKEELLPVCGGLFVYSGQLGVIYDSQAANRSAAGGRGLSREFSVLPIGLLGVIYDEYSCWRDFLQSGPLLLVVFLAR